MTFLFSTFTKLPSNQDLDNSADILAGMRETFYVGSGTTLDGYRVRLSDM
jgi:hypothetical protein